MENPSANTNNGRGELSKPIDAQWKEIVKKWVARCALHFRAEVTDADYAIYIRGLSDVRDARRLDEAFYRCLKECEFMPHVKDVLDRLPEHRPIGQQYWGRVIKEWTESYGPNHVVRYFLTDEGAKLARIEPI